MAAHFHNVYNALLLLLPGGVLMKTGCEMGDFEVKIYLVENIRSLWKNGMLYTCNCIVNTGCAEIMPNNILLSRKVFMLSFNLYEMLICYYLIVKELQNFQGYKHPQHNYMVGLIQCNRFKIQFKY